MSETKNPKIHKKKKTQTLGHMGNKKSWQSKRGTHGRQYTKMVNERQGRLVRAATEQNKCEVREDVWERTAKLT